MIRGTKTKYNIHPANGECTVSTTRPKQILWKENGEKGYKKQHKNGINGPLRRESKKPAATERYLNNMRWA